jgi:hypothetical protein
MPPVISLDYETFFKKNEYSIKQLGNWRYVHDSQFDPYLLSAYDGQESWVGTPQNFPWEICRGATLVAHNAAFERAVTGALVEMGVAPAWVLDNEWQCTANLTSCLAGVRALDYALKVMENRIISKGIREDMSGKTWADAVKLGLSGKLAEYAAGDTIECYGLWTKYSPRWSSFERQLSELTMRQCSRGVRINTELLEQYIKVLAEVIFNLERGLPWTERGKRPTSPIAIAEQCRAVGIPAPPIKGEDEEGFNEWESTYGPKFPWVYSAGQWRSLNKLLTSLETIKDRLREDDTIDFSLLYFGGHTGRWSGGGSGFNMQNMRKVPLFIKNMQLVPPPENLGVKDLKDWIAANTDFQLDIRKLFIARPNKKFILADLSQIEPRVLAWLTGNWKLLNLLKGGMNLYEAFARTSMGWTGGVLKTENADIYNLSKIQVLGLGYGCGWEKFIAIASGYGVHLDDTQSKLIVSTFREQNTPIIKLWGKLDSAFQRSVKHDFEMELPSGRSMNYRKVEKSVRMKQNRETGKYENKVVFTAMIGKMGKVVRNELYGGMLTENLVQATAREIFGEHLLELERGVGDVIFHVHDEAITEVDNDVTVKDVEHVMSKTPEWMPNLPCACEARESQHYLK